jgi:hypothetical protein
LSLVTLIKAGILECLYTYSHMDTNPSICQTRNIEKDVKLCLITRQILGFLIQLKEFYGYGFHRFIFTI